MKDHLSKVRVGRSDEGEKREGNVCSEREAKIMSATRVGKSKHPHGTESNDENKSSDSSLSSLRSLSESSLSGSFGSSSDC